MSSKFKVPNPFSLLKNFVPEKKKEVEYFYEIDKDDKPKKKKKKKGNVDWDEEMTSLGFSFLQLKDRYKIYRYDAIPSLFVFWNTLTNEISMYYEKKILTKINFMPNNRLFIEILVKKTIENLK